MCSTLLFNCTHNIITNDSFSHIVCLRMMSNLDNEPNIEDLSTTAITGIYPLKVSFSDSGPIIFIDDLSFD